MKKRAVSSVGCALLLVTTGGCAVSHDGDDAPSETTATGSEAWDAESATEEALSTHLWIVDHAISLLASRSDLPSALAMGAFMNVDACRTQWQQGLIDADFLAEYNNGSFDTHPGDGTVKLIASGATWKSHFYDPDTAKNYKGESDPTARTQAARHLSNAASSWSARLNDTACYELGLALHYMTDATQPMHASNFTAKNRAVELHTNVEAYSMEIQDRFVRSDAAALDTSTPDAALVSAAYAAKALWPALLQAIYSAYQNNGWTCSIAYHTWLVDEPSCWRGDSGVDAQIGAALDLAQKSAAEYLYAASSLFQDPG